MSDLEEDEGSGGDGGGSPAWMATFGDLMSLLLCFFVLLLSFATMDIIKFTQAVGSLQDAFGIQQEVMADFKAMSTSPIELSKAPSSSQLDILETPTSGRALRDEPSKMITEIREAVDRLQLKDVVEIENEERGVVLRVNGKLLFASGQVALRPESHPFLAEVARIAQAVPHRISIEGHSDDQAVSSVRFPSNWHLASARAISTLDHLAKEGGVDLTRMNSASFGPMRPLVPNDSDEGRATNRRVEFVFVREGPVDHSRFAPGTPERVLDEAGAFD